MRLAVAAALLVLAACSEEKAVPAPALVDVPLADSAAMQARAIAKADADVRAAEAAESRAAAVKPTVTQDAADR